MRKVCERGEKKEMKYVLGTVVPLAIANKVLVQSY